MNPMRRIITWLFPPPLYLSMAKRRQREWEQRSEWLLKKMDIHSSALKTISNRVEDDLKRAEELEREHKITIDALRAELEVCEGTVKALEASHSLILKRIDADLAVQTRREVAMQVREDVV